MPEHTPAPTASRAVYGFAMYFSFKLFFIIYLIWAYVPDSWLESIGITYLPRRYWAIAIPTFLLTVLTVFGFLILPGLGLCMTPNFDDIRTVKDEKSRKFDEQQNRTPLETANCCCKDKTKCFKHEYDKMSNTFPYRRVPLLCDLNIVDVSERLYLK